VRKLGGVNAARYLPAHSLNYKREVSKMDWEYYGALIFVAIVFLYIIFQQLIAKK